MKVPTPLNEPEVIVSLSDAKPGHSDLMHSLFFGVILTIFYLCYNKKWEDMEHKLEAVDYVWLGEMVTLSLLGVWKGKTGVEKNHNENIWVAQ